MRRKDWLQQDLTEWAEWAIRQMETGGYNSVNILHRLIAGDIGNSEFKSSIPIGVEPTQHYLQRLNKAMADLSDDKRKARYILAMKLYYLLGPKRIKPLLTKDYSTFFRWRKRGENQLRAFMQGENKELRQDA